MAVNNLIKLRRGSDWSSNPTLAEGEPGFDTSTNTLKIGDGSTAWNLLQPVNSGLVHPIIAGASSSDNSSNTFIQDLLLDANGHVTGIATGTASEGGGGGISNVVEDTSPQLGGNLDLNSKNLTGTGDIDITGSGTFTYVDGTCGLMVQDGGGSGIHIGDCALSGNAGYAGIKHSSMTGNTDYMMVSDGSDTYISAKDGESVFIRGGGNAGEGGIKISDVGAGGVSTIFNEAGSDRDIRMEGTGGETNLFRLDASENRIGIGTDTPATKLDVNGIITGSGFKTQSGTSSQFLKADGSVDTNTYSTTDTQLTQEQVEDFVGGMVTGNTETGITVTYDDSDGTLDFVVASQTDENFTTADHSKLDGIEASADVTDTANVTSAGALMDSEVTNLAQVKAFDSSDYATAAQGTKADTAQQPPSEGAFANGDKTKLDGIETGATADQTDEEIQDIVGAMLTGNTETGITVTYQDADGTIDFAVASQTDENFTTADHSKLDGIEASADVTDTANVTAAGALMDSELTDLAGVKGVTISTLQVKPSEGAFANGDKTKLDGIEANATADQTDEEIQDIVGAMLTGNTETGITVTYQDADGTIDFAVASQTDENFTTADHSKLDGIEASADVTDTANVTAAGALMDSELTDLAGVKGVTISTLQPKPSEGAFANGDKTKLDGIEASADVTDATNVNAAGAVMNTDTSTSSMDFVIDEDNMSSNSATKVPTQQSVKAYVDANSGGGGGGSMTTVKANGSQVGGADIVTLDFASDFTIGETPDTEINISIADGAITSSKMTTSTLVLNEAGAAGDFRVEGDTDTQLLFVDGSADKVGIGTDSPSYTLHVDGNIGLTNEGFYAASTGVILGVDGWIYNDGGISMSHGRFGADGDAQNTTYILRGATTNASFTTIQNNGADVVLASNRTMMFTANIVGRRTDQVNASNSDNAAYVLKGCLHNDGYGAALVGSVSKTVIAETDSNWDVQATVTGAGAGGADQINIQCKGANSKNVNWVAKLELLEVGGSVPNYTESNILNTFQNEIIP